MPVPLSGTDVTAGVALLVIWSVVLRACATVGVKEALMTHVAPGATGSVQWLSTPNSAELPPWRLTSEMARGAVPLLVTVMSWAARPNTMRVWPKSIDEGETAMTGDWVFAVAVPLSATESDWPKELCGTTRVAESGPEAAAEGWKVTEIWQVASVATGCVAQPSLEIAKRPRSRPRWSRLRESRRSGRGS